MKLKVIILLTALAVAVDVRAESSDDIDIKCGVRMQVSEAGSPGTFNRVSKEVAIANKRIDKCRRKYADAAARKAAIEALPVGAPYLDATINGTSMIKCSHGGVCHQHLLQQMSR